MFIKSTNYIFPAVLKKNYKPFQFTAHYWRYKSWHALGVPFLSCLILFWFALFTPYILCIPTFISCPTLTFVINVLAFVCIIERQCFYVYVFVLHK